MLKLSFIVPVYNVAPYLRKSLDSLIAQDYENYEIILVDDGSTDRSGAICDEYVRLNELENERVSELGRPPIRVIHQANGGLSAARNAGLKVAKGEYVCFVDSDDYWEENVLGGLMEQVEREKLDVLRFDYQNVRSKASPQQCSTDGLQQSDRAKLFTRKGKGVNAGKMILGEYEVFEPNKTPRYIDRRNEIVDGETYLNTRMSYACYAVMFLVRRSLIYKGHMTLDAEHLESAALDSMKTDDSCLFTPGIHFEDVDWLPRMMLRAKRVNSTQTTVYNYFVRQGSITKTQGDEEKIQNNIDNRLFIINKYRQYIKQYPTCGWLKNMQSNMVAGVLTTVARSFYPDRKKYIERLRTLNVFPLSIADQGRTYVRRALLINLFGAGLYCKIIHRN